MKKKILQFTKWAVLICLGVFIVKGCIPTTLNMPSITPRTTTQYWDLPTGSQIAYTHIASKGAKKPYPIIYLHGGPGGYVYTKNIETLGKLSELGYDVYLYDQVGCGLSERLENISEYTAVRHVKDLSAIIKLLGVEKVILVGQSWGGALASLYSADNLNKVDRIVFTCPGAIKPANEALEKIKAPDSLHLKEPYNPNAKVLPIVLNPRYVSIGIWSRFFGKKLASDKEADAYLTNMANVFTKGLVCDPAKALKEEGGAGGYCNLNTSVSYGSLQDPRIKLKNNNIPVLVLKGQYDNIDWGYTKEYLELFRNSRFQLIPNAGHQIFAEQPELYIKTISDFLTK
jgi:proline iminopeptidase